MKKNRRGFSLTEVLVALVLGGVAVAGMTQFFLSQLHQYYLITNSNGLNYDLRMTSKFLEKDIRNSLEFYTSANLSNARTTFTSSATAVTFGECLLVVLEGGRVDKGRGCIYFRGDNRTKNGRQIRSFYRTICTFNTGGTVVETEATLKSNAVLLAEDCLPLLNNGAAVFSIRPRASFAGGRIGLFMGAEFRRGSGKNANSGSLASTFCQLCFYSRNPHFK